MASLQLKLVGISLYLICSGAAMAFDSLWMLAVGFVLYCLFMSIDTRRIRRRRRQQKQDKLNKVKFSGDPIGGPIKFAGIDVHADEQAPPGIIVGQQPQGAGAILNPHPPDLVAPPVPEEEVPRFPQLRQPPPAVWVHPVGGRQVRQQRYQRELRVRQDELKAILHKDGE